MLKLYTIGYGGRHPRELVGLLKQHGVRTVADVRLRPDRASLGVYKLAKSPEKGIQGLLLPEQIDYAPLTELGNVFFHDPHWPERYRWLVNHAGAVLTERLPSLPQPVCLLCAEKDVNACHRLYIAQYLAPRGWQVEHL